MKLRPRLQFTVGRKIAIGFGIVVCLLLVLVATSHLALRRAGRNLDTFAGSVGEARLGAAVDAAVTDLRLHANDYLANHQQDAVDAYVKSRGAVTKLFDQASSAIKDPNRAASLAEARKLFDEYDRQFMASVDLRKAADQIKQSVIDARGDLIEHNLDQYQFYFGGSSEGAASRNAYFRLNATVGMYALSGNADMVDSARGYLIVVSNTVKGMLGKIQSTPAKKRTAEMQTCATLLAETQGALDDYKESFEQLVANYQQADAAQSRLEQLAPAIMARLGQVADSLKTQQDRLEAAVRVDEQRSRIVMMAIALLGVVAGVVLAVFITRGITVPIRRVVEHLRSDAANTAQAALRSGEVSRSLADGTSRQSEALGRTQGCLEAMRAMNDESARHAQTTTALASETRAAADAGTLEIQELKSAMEAIQSSSKEIASINQTIEELAFQTNLLALNAAIEAARAGSAGAGFAVVADEVRRLAQRSAQAAQDTKGRIEASAVNGANGRRIGELVAARLDEIIAKTRQVDESAHLMNEAARRQSQGVAEMGATMAEIEQVTHNNQAHAAQSSDAAAELERQSTDLNRIVRELATMMSGSGDASRATAAARLRVAKDAPALGFPALARSKAG